MRKLHPTIADIMGAFHYERLLHGDWEEAIATICSMHMESIGEMILEHAVVTPAKIALSDSSGTTSYQELCRRACALSLWLVREHGLQAGDVVGVVLPPSHASVVCLVGLGLAGMVPCCAAKCSVAQRATLQCCAASSCVETHCPLPCCSRYTQWKTT